MNKILLTAVGLATCINALAVDFKAEVTDEAKKTCRITALADPDDYLISGTLALPSIININGYPYTVTAVGDHALDGLTSVTKIVIPQAVVRIGDSYESNRSGNTNNFNDCPKLQTFEVSQGNGFFSATADGLLLGKTFGENNGNVLVRTPQAVKVTNGLLKLPANVTALGESAFTGVTTVTTLSLGPVTSYPGNSGINSMPWLGNITVYDSNSIFTATNGVLINPQHGHLIAFPARKMQGSYTIPSGITAVMDNAFANTLYLSDVTISSTVTEIGEAAFSKSHIRKASIPASVTEIGDYAFSECPDLTSIAFKGSISKVPDHMAKKSSKLASVTYAGGLPEKIGIGAFADCEALKEHPFTNFHMGDSAFANTGFETVIFDDAAITSKPVGGGYWSNYIFDGCKNLTKIDASLLVTTPELPFYAGTYFAANCPLLTDLYFPSYTYFSQTYIKYGSVAVATRSPKLNKIILGSFTRRPESWNNKPLFELTPLKPHIFMKVDGLEGATQNGASVSSILAQADKSDKFKPIFYWESPYAPASDYVVDNATYYIPGASMGRFSEAINAGCYVEEFFRLDFSTVNNGLVITLKEIFPEMVKLKKVATDAMYWKNPAYGAYNTAIPPQYVKWVKITYTVHGVEYTTTYDQEFIASADTPDLSADPTSDEAPVYYNLQGEQVTTPLPGQIYIVRQNGTTTKRLL